MTGARAKTADEAATPAARLLAGVEVFNESRRLDLHADLDLRETDLAGADLRGALLNGARMDRCCLDDADLRGASLVGASLRHASLRRADLRGACLGPADLAGASLVAARGEQASLRDVDLTTCDLTDCDLRGADLHGARLGLPRSQPPAAEDLSAVLNRLAQEPAHVRDALGTIAIVTFLAGDRGDAADDLVAVITTGLGLDEDDIQRLMPRGPVDLDRLSVVVPASDWARRAAFAWMCAIARASARVVATQVQVLGHFGAALGLGRRALTRIIGAELGIGVGTPG